MRPVEEKDDLDEVKRVLHPKGYMNLNPKDTKYKADMTTLANKRVEIQALTHKPLAFILLGDLRLL